MSQYQADVHEKIPVKAGVITSLMIIKKLSMTTVDTSSTILNNLSSLSFEVSLNEGFLNYWGENTSLPPSCKVPTDTDFL